MRRHAHVTLVLVAVIVIGFLHQVQVAAGMYEGSALNALLKTTDQDVLLRSGAAYRGMNLATDWWRLFTSIFVHAGFIHIAFNLIALLSIGEILENLFGARILLLSFTIGGMTSALAAMAVPEAPQADMIYMGASGSIFALAGTLLMGLRRAWRREQSAWSRNLSSRLVGCLAANLVLGLTVSAVATLSGLPFIISNSAHIGGLAGGALVGLLPLQIRRNDVTDRLRRMFEPRGGSAANPAARRDDR